MYNDFRNHLENAPYPAAHRQGRRRFLTNAAAARCFAVLLAVLGLACMIFTDVIHSVFPYILGGFMVIIGGFDILRGVFTGEFRRVETKLTSNGIVMVLLGLVIMFSKGDADAIVGSVWGAIGLFKGSEELNVAIYHRFAGKPFVGGVIHAVVELILAIILLLDPLAALRNHMLVLGLELIWYSIKLFREPRERK